MTTDPATLHATRILLHRLAITPTDLTTTTAATPTFIDAVPHLRTTLTPGTLRTYDTHLRWLETTWAHRQLDTVTVAELHDRARSVQREALHHTSTRNGTSAREHFVSATRCLYRYAERNNWIHPTRNPARTLALPRRAPSHRHAIPSPQLAQICHTAALTGNDAELDTLLLRLHIETACRRAGALNLRLRDLDPHHCLIHLREKNNTDRYQPVSPTLMHHLLHHAHHRYSPPDQQLLRYRNTNPVTTRRYDHLWNRLGRHLPWVATRHISTHWLRHTTLTWVERTFGHATAHAYAGHHNPTTTYTKADLTDIATALTALTREPHPLATTTPPRPSTH
ncbi:tyrosine-type recombinase/integrase [Nocardia gamkensis]|uniref:Tyrosine-type recombinase/integrase n=2 Tax=Nocardia gamkensis TaxID=352869 RepID=A0A7X6L9W5_9NOCA|nr:site-specific integrase [Nocardia gamkensis]NKY30584.1 tyrosine-type recombinase/integrase [Nocardia gamkensis]